MDWYLFLLNNEEGDNKSSSFDSRNHGPIPICLVKGKVFLSLCPF